MKIDDYVGIGIICKEPEGDGVNYRLRGLQSKVILAGELLLMLVIEMKRQNVPSMDRLVVRRFHSERLDLMVEEAELLDI